uniref:Uncharacterized protein n=1 Tax=Arundo donax TaxID=35708 RepID=A0A0A9DJB8_ARUDO
MGVVDKIWITSVPPRRQSGGRVQPVFHCQPSSGQILGERELRIKTTMKNRKHKIQTKEPLTNRGHQLLSHLTAKIW